MTVGGTGIGKRDITVDTLEPLLERKLDGLMEAARSFGQKRTPYAAMSRGVAGFIDRSLVVTCREAVVEQSESMAAILPALVHILMFAVIYHIREAMSNDWLWCRTWID